MFKILKWISPSTGENCEAMMPVSKLEPILEILQQKGINVEILEDPVTVSA
ncbi:hypothetical protein OAU44_00065 [bacterium]|jgi:hypothetical protein|nr:hypothetical protein [bacterium]